jgi:secretion/DNA translocation related TadE-like protein
VTGRRWPADERGSATVWVLALSGVLAMVGAAAVLVGVAVTARHRAAAAADFAALAAATRAVQGLADGCTRAAEVATANAARLTACSVAPDGVAVVEVTVPVRLGRLGVHEARGHARAGPIPSEPAAQVAGSSPRSPSRGPSSAASSSRTTSSTRTAPALSSGSLPLPHLGDCTQDGQPLSHSQLATVARVACSQRRSTAKPRSLKPAPPG